MAYNFKEMLKNLAFRSLYASNIHAGLRYAKQYKSSITVLCLHRVSTEEDHFWDPIKPDRFEQLIKYLIKHYDIIPVSAIHEKQRKRPRAILSFDDGYFDFFENVLPLLNRYSLPSNHNIVANIASGKQQVIWTESLNFLFNYLLKNKPDDVISFEGREFILKQQYSRIDSFYIEILKSLFKLEQAERLGVLDNWLNRYNLIVTGKKMMGWKEIKECAANGVEFGSHTQTHPILTAIQNGSEMYTEIFDSKTEIEKNLGKEITILAPPNGMCNDDVLNQARAAGYKFVLGIDENSYIKTIGSELTFLSRLNLISEPYSHMVLRIEEVQQRLKQVLRR